ncbi:unnamed protein product [Clonostachys rosea f. rosea IK726]|uniref:Fe2OG dioxygenase domain-containing protein n=2 Tax=Bionectria ochroleuca TaxID=29856 RepID=A0A0B7KG52_BIOOC|nr:unnamed protein product [Clonostachys rosea f. rosea IK726]
MSQTTVDTRADTKVRTVKLQNGDVFSFNSNISTELEKIPVIDASRIWSDKLEDRKAVAEEIRDASRNIGFFYLINHGIDQDYATEVIDQAKRFFALPEEKKMEVFTGLVPNDEAFNWAYDASEDPEAVDKTEPSVSIWPSNLPGFREGLYAYHTKLLELSRRLTRIFALALHLPEEYFDEYVRRPEAGMRILHYPEQKHSVDDQNGIGAHTDVECFTIVTQDLSGGLEVLSKSGNWIKAEPIEGSFVVNIADAFMRQTNNFFVSTIHRVINKSGHERYSAPFFFGFDRKKLLEPVPTCVSEENPMKYPIMTGGEYYAWRTNKQKNTNTCNDKIGVKS